LAPIFYTTSFTGCIKSTITALVASSAVFALMTFLIRKKQQQPSQSTIGNGPRTQVKEREGESTNPYGACGTKQGPVVRKESD
jgi:uncharacterized protein YfaQ (DUF2300 family)